MINFKKVTKNDLITLIEKYKYFKLYPCNWSIRSYYSWFRFFKHNPDVKRIHHFIQNQLAKKPLNYELSVVELGKLVDILRERFHRILNTEQAYGKATRNIRLNNLYAELAMTISDDPHVLCLIHMYLNDRFAGQLVANLEEELYVLPGEGSNAFVIPIDSLEKYFKANQTFYFYLTPLNKNNIETFKNISPGLRNVIQEIENRFAGYIEKTSIFGGPLAFLDPRGLFVTGNHCYYIEDIINLSPKNHFIIPHTAQEFSPEDCERIKVQAAICYGKKNYDEIVPAIQRNFVM